MLCLVYLDVLLDAQRAMEWYVDIVYVLLYILKNDDMQYIKANMF